MRARIVHTALGTGGVCQSRFVAFTTRDAPPCSPYRDEITLGILQLQESNRLEILKRRWWEGGQCLREEDHRAKGLGMENIGGIFVVLICGLIIAVFVAIMEFVWSTRRSAETDEVSVCQEMLTEFRNAVSCKKSSRSRHRRRNHHHLTHLASTGVLRPPSRLALSGPRPIRLVRDMRLSNGKLYSGVGSSAMLGSMPPDLGPGPQRLLDEALGLNVPIAPPTTLISPPTSLISPPTSLIAPPPPPPPRSFLQNCSHVRICQECRRIQSLRSPSSYASSPSGAVSPPRAAPLSSRKLRLHYHYHRGSMSLPRLPQHAPPQPITAERADSDGGSVSSPWRSKGAKPLPPPRPVPPAKSQTSTDLLGSHD
uniref:Uncharacterized protein n=2 Tax=Knipowitschia caucasica TaxID=637954 RepID=A0AAV2K4N4_KNICA